jgi:FkbM family methyltransferase
MFNSQFGEDQWIAENLTLQTNGTFIDVGADQPIFGSNSYYFEYVLGWDCICIDADSRTIPLLRKHRKNVIHSLVSDFNGTATFKQESLPGISHIDSAGNVKMPTRTLNSILEEFSVEQISILDVDVEGHELAVCGGLNWEKYKPEIVIIEFISPAGGNIETQLVEFFDSLQSYELVHKTQANLIFKRTI